jgi:hypothetical protein
MSAKLSARCRNWHVNTLRVVEALARLAEVPPGLLGIPDDFWQRPTRMIVRHLRRREQLREWASAPSAILMAA